MLSVADTDELSAIETSSLVNGDLAFVLENTTHYYFLQDSTAPLSGTVFPSKNSLDGDEPGRWIALDNVSPTFASATISGDLTVGGSLRLRSTIGSAKNQTSAIESNLTTTDDQTATIYSFTPNPSTTIRIYSSIAAVKTDGSDDYGVDIVASFRVAANGTITSRLAATKMNEQTASASIGTVTIDASDGLIRVRVTGVLSQSWNWAANTSVVERSIAA